MFDKPSPQPANDMSPAVAMRHLNTGYWISQAIAVAAQLGIADLLKHGPKTCDELAQAAGTNPQALYRLLRGTASVGVFAEDAHGRFTLTPLATLLRADVPGSLRAAAMMSGADWEWRPWGRSSTASEPVNPRSTISSGWSSTTTSPGIQKPPTSSTAS